jgi:hypothetical protein
MRREQTDISAWIASGREIKKGKPVIAKGSGIYRDPLLARAPRQSVRFKQRGMAQGQPEGES